LSQVNIIKASHTFFLVGLLLAFLVCSPSAYSANVNIDAQAITAPVITSPNNGTVTTYSLTRISGTGGSNVVIRIYLNDVLYTQTTTSLYGNWSAEIYLQQSKNTIYAVTYINGVESSASNTIEITYFPLPNPQIITPPDYENEEIVFTNPSIKTSSEAKKQQSASDPIEKVKQPRKPRTDRKISNKSIFQKFIEFLSHYCFCIISLLLLLILLIVLFFLIARKRRKDREDSEQKPVESGN